MEQLLNADGTPSFTNISNLRTNFEESFARKQLGATMKSIVIKCINHIENNNAAEVLSDEKIRGIVKGSIEEVADKCFTNDELNGSSYIGGLKKIVKEYAGMEAAYREDLANAILATESDKAVAGGKILELFSTENLKFTDRNLFKRYSDELESTFALEGEEIVTEIGKEVGAAIAEAEEKNVIINETSKVIQDKQDEIREELATTDEDDEEEGEDTSSDNEEFDDSEDDGEELSEEDEENTDNDNTSTEGYEMGVERFIGLNSDEREEALKFLDSKRSQIEKSFETFYDKLDKGLTSFEKKDETYHITRYFEDKKDFKDEVSERLDKLYAGLHNKKKLFGNSVNKMRFKLCSVRGMNNVKYITTFILSCIPYVGGLISYALILTDEDERKAQKVVKTVGDAASSVFETKIYIKTGINDGEYITYDLFFYLKINLKKFWNRENLKYRFSVRDLHGWIRVHMNLWWMLQILYVPSRHISTVRLPVLKRLPT